MRAALPTLDPEGLKRIDLAAADCVEAAERADIAAELAAKRRFRFAILNWPDQPHAIRVIGLLWNSTEAYRAPDYYSPNERRESIRTHDRMIAGVRARDAAQLIAALDQHRERAIEVLIGTLSPSR